MSETIPHTAVPAKQWVDLYLNTGIPKGSRVSIQNIGSSQVSIVEAEAEPRTPPPEDYGFNIVKPCEFVSNKQGSLGLWAYSNTGTTLQLSQSGILPASFADTGQTTPLTASGEVRNAQVTPLTQITAQYGLGENIFTVVDSGSSGSVSSNNSLFICQTGTAADGLATILTLRELTFRAGQGILARFTAEFTSGVANSQQAAGLINAENSFTFGFANDQFGILYASDGEVEYQELTVTTPAAGSENATITVDGIGYTVPLTSGTASHNAIEIAGSLNTQVPNYRFSANNAEVTALAVVSGPQGSFAFTSATAVASWVQVNAGANVTVDFIPQANWNIDTLSDFNLDPTTLNAFEIEFTYSGCRFSIIDNEGDIRDVHYISSVNVSATPIVTTPSFRCGWIARNLGNTSDLTVSGASASGFVEGEKRFDSGIRAEDSAALGIGLVNTSLLCIRNRIEFGDRINRAELLPRFISVSTDSNKASFFRLILNPTFSSDVVFSYIDEENSIAEFSEDNVTITGGRLVGSVTASSGASVTVSFNDEPNTDTFVAPGDILCLSGRVSSGGAADMDVSISWQEDV